MYLIKHMEAIIKVCRAMGWCWCWPKKRVQDGFDLDPFLIRRLPVFWVMGPPKCGKTTIAKALARASDYRLVKINDLIDEEVAKDKWNAKVIKSCMELTGGCPTDIILNLLKVVFATTYDECIGYILDGFPADLREAKQFEFEICKVYIIIYPTLTVDAYMLKMVDHGGDRDHMQEKYEKAYKLSQEVYRYYEQKTLKCLTIYPLETTLNGLILDLDQYFGYKFRF